MTAGTATTKFQLNDGMLVLKPEDIIPSLAKGEKHWRKGYSAYELATSWVGAGDIPTSVRSVLSGVPCFRAPVLREGIFERTTDLGTPGRRSQTDLLAIVDTASGPV